MKVPIELTIENKLLKTHFLQPLDISVGIRNIDTKSALMIESLALRFESKRQPSGGTNKADSLTTVPYAGAQLQLSPGQLGYITIRVTPSLVFRKYTNRFDIVVTYFETGKARNRETYIGSGLWSVIIEPAPRLFGRVFISFKDPEDRALANQLFDLAEDAGFEPYIAPADVSTGSKIWSDKIPQAIAESKVVFVIWTSNTPRGKGVRKEIRLARRNGVKIAPLLHDAASAPRILGKDVEYQRFDDKSAIPAFGDVLAAARRAT